MSKVPLKNLITYLFYYKINNVMVLTKNIKIIKTVINLKFS